MTATWYGRLWWVRQCRLQSSVWNAHHNNKWFSTFTAGDISIKGTLPSHGRGVALQQYAFLDRIFTEHDVGQYGRLIGDENPLHQAWPVHNVPHEIRGHMLLSTHQSSRAKSDTSDSSCQHTLHDRLPEDSFTRPLVHGMLVASIFSGIFGTLMPGSVYLQQKLDFRRPVYTQQVIRGQVTITRLRPFPKRGGLIMTCQTQVLRISDQANIHDNEVSLILSGEGHVECIRGEADVWVLQGEEAKSRGDVDSNV